MPNKILFILKRKEDFRPNKDNVIGLSTGLYNSASFVKDMLVESSIDAELEVAIDNNCIDRLVTKHNPSHVIIEALWVVPSKFSVLCKLHPTVKWIVRLHSELPFMAGEGIAMDWIGDYLDFPNLYLGVNAPRMLEEMKEYLKTRNRWTYKYASERVIYLPNYYPKEYKTKSFDKNKHWIDIACFGAIRPLKNHLVQALAAIKFANNLNKQLRFHVNSDRVEMKGDVVVNNLKGLFQQLEFHGHSLIFHEWVPREEFLQICSKMDIGLQCNFSETFNIVSADLISQGVPIVGSDEIPWSSSFFNAHPSNSDDIARVLKDTYYNPNFNVWRNRINLDKYTSKTRKIWSKYFKGIKDEAQVKNP